MLSHQGIIREFVWNTYEKLEMDADWWKNDAAKVNEMESATVKHKIEFNYGGKKLQWKSAREIIKGETVLEVATEMRSAMGKAWKREKILSRSTPWKFRCKYCISIVDFVATSVFWTFWECMWTRMKIIGMNVSRMLKKMPRSFSYRRHLCIWVFDF